MATQSEDAVPSVMMDRYGAVRRPYGFQGLRKKRTELALTTLTFTKEPSLSHLSIGIKEAGSEEFLRVSRPSALSHGQSCSGKP